MKVSVEISKYPLAEVDFVTAIKDFIDRINQYPGVEIVTNNMSTQLFGDYDLVTELLNREIKRSFELYGTCVFVCKYLPGDLKNDKIAR